MIKALTIFSGNGNRELSDAICGCVEVRPILEVDDMRERVGAPRSA